MSLSITPLARHGQIKDTVELRFEITATRAGMAQLFYDRGSGFNEADSFRVNFPAGSTVTLAFSLPDGLHSRLRLNPTYLDDSILIDSPRLVRKGDDN